MRRIWGAPPRHCTPKKSPRPHLTGEEGIFLQLREVEGNLPARGAFPVALQHHRFGVELPVAVATDLTQHRHRFLHGAGGKWQPHQNSRFCPKMPRVCWFFSPPTPSKAGAGCRGDTRQGEAGVHLRREEHRGEVLQAMVALQRVTELLDPPRQRYRGNTGVIRTPKHPPKTGFTTKSRWGSPPRAEPPPHPGVVASPSRTSNAFWNINL